MRKITFTAKVIAEISNDPKLTFGDGQSLDEPSLRWLKQIIEEGRYTIEMADAWDSSGEPSFIITEKQ